MGFKHIFMEVDFTYEHKMACKKKTNKKTAQQGAHVLQVSNGVGVD